MKTPVIAAAITLASATPAFAGVKESLDAFFGLFTVHNMMIAAVAAVGIYAFIRAFKAGRKR